MTRGGTPATADPDEVAVEDASAGHAVSLCADKECEFLVGYQALVEAEAVLNVVAGG